MQKKTLAKVVCLHEQVAYSFVLRAQKSMKEVNSITCSVIGCV